LNGREVAPSPAIADRRTRSFEYRSLRPVHAARQPPPRHAAAVIRACRPRQWLKNVIVVLAPAAAGALTRPGVMVQTCGALIAFCMLSSATYLVNDVRDRERDRRHPSKRLRPIAAGELSPGRAVRIAAVLATGGVCLSVAVRPALGAVAGCYLALTLSYTLVWRQFVVADIAIVAAAFLVRAAAGGVAADVRLSATFLVVTSACALFLVTGKRYAELRERGVRASTRETLRRYSPLALRRVLVAAATLACLAYGRWALTRSGPEPWIGLSLVPFALWLGRYAMVLESGAGEAPEEVILRDPGLLLFGALWAILFLLGVYGAR
jgi:decaprenyl-phosphate phosphoribosyltransferase